MQFVRFLWVRFTFLAACTLLSPQALAQVPSTTARVGVLHFGDQAFTDPFTEALVAGLAARGYTVGRNLILDVRHADSVPHLQKLAKELLELKPNVVFAASGTAAYHVGQLGPEVPVVFAFAVDPVGQGFAASLSHPGRSMTGLTIQSTDGVAKKLGLLREILPKISRVAMLYPSTVRFAADQAEMARAAQSLGIELLRVGIKQAEDLDGAFGEATRLRAQAMVVLDTPLFTTHRHKIVELASKHRLPTMYGHPGYVEAGGLISYGAERLDLARRAASHIDKILKGAKPGDIPIEQPLKFELLINSKAAKALGIALPQPLLLRADRVLE